MLLLLVYVVARLALSTNHVGIPKFVVYIMGCAQVAGNAELVQLPPIAAVAEE